MVYLADPAKAYNLQAGSFLAAYELEVKTDDKGLLDAWRSTRARRRSRRIGQGRWRDREGALRRHQGGARSRGRCRRQGSRRPPRGGQKVAAAQAKVNELELRGDGEALLDAKVALAQAKAELRVLLLGGLPDAGSANNVAGGGGGAAFPQAWGPVLYLVKQERVNWPRETRPMRTTRRSCRQCASSRWPSGECSTRAISATVPEASVELSLQPQTLKREGSAPLVLTLTGEPSLPDPSRTSVVTTSGSDRRGRQGRANEDQLQDADRHAPGNASHPEATA